MAIKKTTKKAHAKPMAAKPAPAVAAAQPACGCGCRGGVWHFLKKLIIFAIVFALGFAACRFICCGGKHGFHGKRMGHEMFVNGCLDTSKIRSPEMAEKASLADIDGDGCITKKEMKAFKKGMRRE